MEDYQYPYYYQISNQAAIRNQRYFWICLAGQLCSACISVVLESFEAPYWVSGLFVLASLAFFLVIIYNGFPQKWKKCRFCAESIRSKSWQWMMILSVYKKDINGDLFKKHVEKIYIEVKNFCRKEDGVYHENITSEMKRVRNETLRNKEIYYRENRVRDQVNWYTEKAKDNGCKKRKYVGLVVVLYIVFLFTLFFQELPFSFSFLVVIASSIITWLETKKFHFLEESYSSILKDNSDLFNSRFDFCTEKEFKEKVRMCEKKFFSEYENWASKET